MSPWFFVSMEIVWICCCSGLFWAPYLSQKHLKASPLIFGTSQGHLSNSTLMLDESISLQVISFILGFIVFYMDNIFCNEILLGNIALHYSVAVPIFKISDRLSKFKAGQQRLVLLRSLHQLNNVYATVFSISVLKDVIYCSLAAMPGEKGKNYLSITKLLFIIVKLISYILSAFFFQCLLLRS